MSDLKFKTCDHSGIKIPKTEIEMIKDAGVFLYYALREIEKCFDPHSESEMRMLQNARSALRLAEGKE